MQAQRDWIERAFEDAKSHAGLSHYQARNWPAWHRHMALVNDNDVIYGRTTRTNEKQLSIAQLLRHSNIIGKHVTHSPGQ